MAKNLEEARKDLEEAYADVRKHFGEIEQAWRALEKADFEDDLSGLLEHLEDVTKKARTGGMMGSGANKHARALGEYLTLKGKA